MTLDELEFVNFFIFINLNLRMEAPLINSRIRKSFLVFLSNFLVFNFGSIISYTGYPILNLGNSLLNFSNFIQVNYII